MSGRRGEERGDPDADPDGHPRRDGRTTDTRDRILAAALEAFIEQGFATTTLQDIADRLGLTKAALYYHFKSKDELVRAVMRPLVEALHDYAEASRSAEVTPRQLLERYFDIVHAHRAECLALTRDPSGAAAMSDEDWLSLWLVPVQARLLPRPATTGDRVRLLAAISGLGRSFLLHDVPLEELRPVTVEVALETLAIGPDRADAPLGPLPAGAAAS